MKLMTFTSFSEALDFINRCPHNCKVWDFDQFILVEWQA
jgi:hypothetical protein